MAHELYNPPENKIRSKILAQSALGERTAGLNLHVGVVVGIIHLAYFVFSNEIQATVVDLARYTWRAWCV